MRGADESGRILRFGVFELDVASGELRKSGTRIRLQEQPFQVLRALVEKPGEVVTREELQQRLWPDDTFVDFEDGLSTAVKKIRRALGDSAANPRFVETLPKRGYRFIAPVEGLGPQRRVQERRRPLLPWLLAAGAVVAVGVVYSISRDSGGTIPWEPVPFTSYPGSETNPTFSPDGERVAFQWCHEGECDIYIKLVGSESRQRLTDHPGQDGNPAWSPDGKQIAFLRRHEGERSLQVVPSIGGVERELARGEESVREYLLWGPLLAWHPSGKWIAYADRSKTSRGIVAVSVESGRQHTLTNQPESTLADGCLAFSPKGDELLFCRVLHWTTTAVYRMTVTDDPTATAKAVRVPVAEECMNNWVWMPGGREITGQARRLAPFAKLELREGARARLLGIGRNAHSVAYSATAKRLVYAVVRNDRNVWRLDLGEAGAEGPPSPVVASTSQDHQADISPDGSRIAFWSNRTGHPEVWVSDADGSNTRQLTRLNGAGGVSFPQWSPDGSEIVFGTNRDGDFDLHLIPAGGGEVRKILDDPGREVIGAYTAAADALYVTARRGADMVFECYRMGASKSELTQLTEGGGHYCQPSADGAYLYYSPGEKEGLWRKPAGGGEATQLVPTLASVYNFAVWRGGVYYLSVPDERGLVRLYNLDPETGEKRELAVMDSDNNQSYCLSASADGRRVIWSQQDLSGADLLLVEGFE